MSLLLYIRVIVYPCCYMSLLLYIDVILFPSYFMSLFMSMLLHDPVIYCLYPNDPDWKLSIAEIEKKKH